MNSMKKMKDDVMLVLDCSLRLTGAAVARCGEVLSQESEDLGRRQAAELPLMAERVLAAAGMTFADIDLMAVTSGPGYFTGIRVGVAYAAALAYGRTLVADEVDLVLGKCYPLSDKIVASVF